MRTNRFGRLMSRGAILAALGVASLSVMSPASADAGWTDVPSTGSALELSSIDLAMVQANQPTDPVEPSPRAESQTIEWG
jgi:hypothetical protein